MLAFNNLGVDKQDQAMMSGVINKFQLVAECQFSFMVNFHQWVKITEPVHDNHLIIANTSRGRGE
jgi:hypothetical protein